MSPLKEYSGDDYNRKFKGTLCKCNDEKVHFIYALDSEYIWDKVDSDPIRASPLYHHFQPKYYQWGNRFSFLMRRNRKNYRVGISNETHLSYYYIPESHSWSTSVDGLLKSDYLKQLEFNKHKAFSSYGPLNNSFFVDQRYVFCKIWPVALRKGNIIEIVIPEVEQEIVDALRGVECQIR